MSADAAATDRQYLVADTLGSCGGGCVSDITDLYHWFLGNRRHLVRSPRFPPRSSTSGRALDRNWIELWQVSLCFRFFSPLFSGHAALNFKSNSFIVERPGVCWNSTGFLIHTTNFTIHLHVKALLYILQGNLQEISTAVFAKHKEAIFVESIS